MKRADFLLLLLATLAMTSCHQRPAHITAVSTQAIAIDSTLNAIADSSYLQELSPYTEQLNTELDVVIGHAPEDMPVQAPECLMLNWATEALFAKAQELYPGHVDMAVVNIGGMRSPWKKGDITRRNIFELMPFDNKLVVLTLTGQDILDLCQIFAEDGGQGVAGLRMTAKDKQLQHVTIGGKEVDPSTTYHLATSDYLAGGTDHMIPLTKATETWQSECLIRDLYMQYVEETGTVSAVVDGRMNVQ